MDNLELTNVFETVSYVNLTEANTLVKGYYSRKWSNDIQTVAKLRTYRMFKTEFKCENYITLNLRKNERSALCQFRCGILPLRIETGRYIGETIEDRLCRFCSQNSIENEEHFIFECDLYNRIRSNMFNDIISTIDFQNYSTKDKFCFLFNNFPRKCAKYISQSYNCRRSVIYS